MANKARNSSGSRPAPGGASVKAANGNGAAPKISATVDGGVSGANRKERKEEARRQREAILRKQARRRYWRLGISAAVAVVVLAGAIVLWHPWSKSSATTTQKTFDQANLPGLITTQDLSQWTANTTDLPARITDMGLPPLSSSEQLAFHIHQELQIFIDGHQFTIPQGIGIDEAAGKISVIHVHATDGVIHVESPVVRPFTLGDFFGVWGLNFTPTAIGGFENLGGKTLQVFLNGKPYGGNPQKLPLTDREIIVVAYGTQAELPQIPSTFDWSNSSAG